MYWKMPYPGFKGEVVLVDSNGIVTTTPNAETAAKKTDESSDTPPATVDEGASKPTQNKDLKGHDKDDVFFG
jgi:propanediol dehydratase small subunit